MKIEDATPLTRDPEHDDRLPAEVVWCWVYERTLPLIWGAFFVGFILSISVLPSWSPSLAALVRYLLPLPFLMVAVPSRVRIGDDGIGWTHWPGSLRSGFVPYSALSYVGEPLNGATLALTNGRQIPLYTLGFSRILVTRIRAEIHRRREKWRHLAADPLMAISVTESDNDPYRSAHDPAALMQLVVRQDVAADMRMAAARKLAAHPNDELRAVFRSLSDASAEPRLRELFANIGGGRV